MHLPHFSAGPPFYPPLDTLGLIFYTLFFAAVVLLTMRRPAAGACVLIFVTPFALYQRVFEENLTLPKVALLAVLLGLCTYPRAFSLPVGTAVQRVLFAGALVLCATLISFVHAAHYAPAIRQTLKMVEYLLIFCVVAAAYRLEPDRDLFVNTLLSAAIAVSLFALAQEIVGAPSVLLVNGHRVPRIAGPLEGPNQLAGFFDVAIPAALAFTLRGRLRLAPVALCLMVFADILTFSRGGLIGAAAGAIAVSAALHWRYRAAVLPAAVGIAGGAAVALAWGRFAGSFGMVRMWNYESTYAGGVGTRPELWHAAITLWKEHPIFGVGAGNFQLDIPLTGLQGVRTHANSLYLQALVEGGIPLIAATLWLVYTSIAAFARKGLEHPFAAAAFGASIALALHQIVDFLTFYPKVGGEWWIVMALGAAELAVAARAQVQCV